jgi:hypothetical protein
VPLVCRLFNHQHIQSILAIHHLLLYRDRHPFSQASIVFNYLLCTHALLSPHTHTPNAASCGNASSPPISRAAPGALTSKAGETDPSSIDSMTHTAPPHLRSASHRHRPRHVSPFSSSPSLAPYASTHAGHSVIDFAAVRLQLALDTWARQQGQGTSFSLHLRPPCPEVRALFRLFWLEHRSDPRVSLHTPHLPLPSPPITLSTPHRRWPRLDAALRESSAATRGPISDPRPGRAAKTEPRDFWYTLN